MTPLLASYLTILLLPFANMNMPVGQRKHYMNARVLHFLITSSILSTTYAVTSKTMRNSKIKALDLHRNRSWMLSFNTPRYLLQSNPIPMNIHAPRKQGTLQNRKTQYEISAIMLQMLLLQLTQRIFQD